jgi:hypothetical protein
VSNQDLLDSRLRGNDGRMLPESHSLGGSLVVKATLVAATPWAWPHCDQAKKMEAEVQEWNVITGCLELDL